VYAFEPNPRIASLMRRSVLVNGYGARVEIDPRAAAEATGARVKFWIPPDQSGGARVVANPPINSGNLIEVETIALDDVLPENTHLTKRAGEGAERRVCQGLSPTLARNRNIRIFLEFSPGRYPAAADDFLQEIESGGFTLSLAGYDGIPKRSDRQGIIART